MALVDLLRVLEHDTEAELRAIAAAAEAEAARLDAEAARVRRDRSTTAAAAFAAERSAADDAALADLRARTRGEVLAARAAMLDRIRDAVRAELPAVVARDAALGGRLLAAALACVDGEPGVLRCASPVGAAPANLRVVNDPAIATGVIIELDGGTRIDATLDALLARSWPSLACKALALERTR